MNKKLKGSLFLVIGVLAILFALWHVGTDMTIIAGAWFALIAWYWLAIFMIIEGIRILKRKSK